MADITKVMVVEIGDIAKLGPKEKSVVEKLGPRDKPTAGGHIFSSGEYVLSEASATHTGVLVLVTTSGVNSLEQPSGGIPKYRINTITVTPNSALRIHLILQSTAEIGAFHKFLQQHLVALVMDQH